METLLVCVSVLNGNTRRVADRMADALGPEVVEPESVDVERRGDYDRIRVGSGIYFIAVHPRLRRLIRRRSIGLCSAVQDCTRWTGMLVNANVNHAVHVRNRDVWWLSSDHRSFCGRILVLGLFMLGICLVGSVCPASALVSPSCTNVSSTTTKCQSPGNVQIVTSPGTVATPGWGWPYWGGGFLIVIGGRR